MSIGRINYGSGIVTDGLVLHLDAANPQSFDGNSTTWRDLSGNNYNGTLVNGVSYSNSNRGSMVFDGVDDYTSTSNALLIPYGNQNRTISVWVKVLSLPTDICPLVMTGNDVNKNLFALSIVSTGKFFLWGNSYNYSSTHNVDLNTWINVVVTFDGTNVYIYKNGIKDAGGSLPLLNTTTNSPVRIGYSGGYGQRLSGNISNVLIHNRVLTSDEVLQNYNSLKSRFGL